jgi:drug/metabolite transporter (DMT)-like permease
MLAAYSLSNYNQLHPVETVFAKFLVQAALQIGVTLWKKERVMALRAKNYKGLVVRGIFAACNAFVLVLAQLYLPPTTVYTLTSTGIIFTYLCTYLYSHSKFTRIQTISFLMGALGITTAIIAQTAWPLLNPHYHFHSNFPYNELNAIQQLIGCLVLVVWMGVWACSLLFGQNQLNSDPN